MIIDKVFEDNKHRRIVTPLYPVFQNIEFSVRRGDAEFNGKVKRDI